MSCIFCECNQSLCFTAFTSALLLDGVEAGLDKGLMFISSGVALDNGNEFSLPPSAGLTLAMPAGSKTEVELIPPVLKTKNK